MPVSGATGLMASLGARLSASWAPPLLAFAGAWLLMLFAGGPLISWLKSLKGTKWSPREDTPDTHASKAGTPSMGGLGIIGVALFAYLGLISFVWMASTRSVFPPTSPSFTATGPVSIIGVAPSVAGFFIWKWVGGIALLPVVTLLHALLGFADDWSKATGRGGLRARAKLFFQVALALGFAVALYHLARTQTFQSVRYVYPQLAGIVADPLGYGLLALAFVMLVVIAAGNAVNLTDGLDGLAAGLCVQVGCALWLAGSGPAPSDINTFVILFWACLAGACLGFLKFNRFRAKVFMGDTGSLALGAALGAGCIAGQTLFLLPFVGFIFWVEMLSVVAQVLWFKYTRRRTGEGQRLLRRAPLHHHFELCGWSEWRVVLTFWAVNAAATAIGLALWSADLLPHWP